MSTEIKKRNSNIELLRIIAMFSVVTSHIVTHCIIPQWRMQGAFDLDKKIYILNVMIPWGNVSNDLFLIISGYFLIVKEGAINIVNISKKLLYQLFYSVAILVFISNILYRISGGSDAIHMISIMEINNFSWYIGYYFLVIAIAAFWLNNVLCRIDKETYLKILFVGFSVITFSWSSSFFGGFGGNSGLIQLLTGVFLYVLGGYIRKFEPFKDIRTITLFFIIALFYFMLFIATINFNEIVHHDDQNFFAIITAICLFEIFSRINMPNIRAINFLGASSFMVYLVHDNSFFYNFWDTNDWMKLLTESPASYCLQLFIYGLLTFITGLVCYITYILFMKILEKLKFVFIRKTD